MNIDRQELRDYLLGRMPENLASDLDTRLFSGDELLHRLQEEQDLLSEDFVYGRLTPEDKMLSRFGAGNLRPSKNR